jgi:hypothetical protein
MMEETIQQYVEQQDIEQAEMNHPLVEQTTPFIEQDRTVGLKFVFIFLILYPIAPYAFITLWYGIFDQFNAIDFATLGQVGQIENQLNLYMVCNGSIFAIFGLIALVAIISTNNLDYCIMLLLCMIYTVFTTFNMAWAVLIFIYFR